MFSHYLKSIETYDLFSFKEIWIKQKDLFQAYKLFKLNYFYDYLFLDDLYLNKYKFF